MEVVNSNNNNNNNNNNDTVVDDAIVETTARRLHLFTTTPLVYSPHLSKLATNRPVYLKMECLQPSGSFKDRGMAYLFLQYKNQMMIKKKKEEQLSSSSSQQSHPPPEGTTTQLPQPKLRVLSSSGGNAGLSAACIAQKLHMPCTVVVPTTTKPLVMDTLRNVYNATVIVHGNNWNEADALVQEMIVDAAADRNDSDSTTTTTIYVPPYDHEWLWTGHSTMIDEIYTQLNEFEHQQQERGEEEHDVDAKAAAAVAAPPTIIVSVGGGGLLCGVLEGLLLKQQQQQQPHYPRARVIAMETIGAHSLYASWSQQTMVTLDSITSIATSLGAKSVTPTALSRAQEYAFNVTTVTANNTKNSDDDDNVTTTTMVHDDKNNNNCFTSATCTDAEAVDACFKLAQDHRILVEPACGAALAAVYSDRLRQQLFLLDRQQQQQLDDDDTGNNNDNGPIVIIVCGGSGVNLDLLQHWKTQLEL